MELRKGKWGGPIPQGTDLAFPWHCHSRCKPNTILSSYNHLSSPHQNISSLESKKESGNTWGGGKWL